MSSLEAKLTCKFSSTIYTSNLGCDLFRLKKAAYIIFQLAVTTKCSIQTEKLKKKILCLLIY